MVESAIGLSCAETESVPPLYSDLYKNACKTTLYRQEKKREYFLQKQKEKRSEAFDEKRDLSQLFNESPILMECEESKAKKKHPFRYKLMDSEWFTEVPDDLANNWLFKLCPEGIRYLIVANRAITTCYLKNGKPCMRFKSNLPGGSSKEQAHKFTVLDCIYNKSTNTIFIYDVLAWNSMSLIDAEAHLRFYWLKSKFEEDPELLKTHHYKKFKFDVMGCYPAQIAILQDQLFVNRHDLVFEAVLFYHKEGHYTSGKSPLVGWLKTFMLPEILHIDVDEKHLQNQPENYENVEQYLSSYKTNKNRKIKDVEMLEVGDEEVELCDGN